MIVLCLYLICGAVFVAAVTDAVRTPIDPVYKRGAEYWLVHVAAIVLWLPLLAVIGLGILVTGMLPVRR